MCHSHTVALSNVLNADYSQEQGRGTHVFAQCHVTQRVQVALYQGRVTRQDRHKIDPGSTLARPQTTLEIRMASLEYTVYDAGYWPTLLECGMLMAMVNQFDS